MNPNDPPGATTPEFHPLASDVDVCDTESVFIHVTVEPTATLRSSGANARFPSVDAPIGIETDDDAPPAVGVGDGVGDGVVGDESLLLQPIASSRTTETAAKRNSDIRTSLTVA